MYTVENLGYLKTYNSTSNKEQMEREKAGRTFSVRSLDKEAKQYEKINKITKKTGNKDDTPNKYMEEKEKQRREN